MTNTQETLSNGTTFTQGRAYSSQFDKEVESFSHELLAKFRSFTRFYALFHMGFFALGFLQLLTILLFFSFFTKSTWAAVSLATIFLTGFSYLVLLFYFQAKKPQQFIELRDDFCDKCMNVLPYEKGTHEYHLSFVQALAYCASLIDKQEMLYYQISKQFKTLSPILEKFSIWVHWKDVQKMKELLLLICVEENIALVKAMPVDLEAHASLATSYTRLARLYLDPRKVTASSYPWASPEYNTPAMKEKFRAASERAIEELKILNDYAPNDPWIHAQLASIYHDKEMPEDEIREYETLLQISPADREVVFRLGKLYFEQGHTARGLRLYQQLQVAKDKKADELIEHYDSFPFQAIVLETIS